MIPWATFTEPEVARVGLNETEAKEKNIPYEVTTYGIDDLDRAIADGEAQGVVKVLTVPGKDRILGVTIAGEHAGDLIVEYITAMKHGIGLNKILGTIHIYPTLVEANKYAAGEWKRKQVTAGQLAFLERSTRGAAMSAASASLLGAPARARLRQAPRVSRRSALTNRFIERCAACSPCSRSSCSHRTSPLHSITVTRPGTICSRRTSCGSTRVTPPRCATQASRASARNSKAYLDSLSAVTRDGVRRLEQAEQLAFLINAYNAFTIEKILTRYPKLKSIRDFGTFVGNPWKDKFFTLLGTPMSLDGIEHDTIRKPGVYDDPRIHFAVNCASIGCPALRNEAYVADRLDAPARGPDEALPVRPLPQSLRAGVGHAGGVEDLRLVRQRLQARERRTSSAFLRPLCSRNGRRARAQQAIRDGKAKIAFLDYDWALNDVRK